MMTPIFSDFAQQNRRVTAILGLGITIATLSMVTLSAQAELTFKPLPNEQASIIPQNQLATNTATPIAQPNQDGLSYYPLPSENPAPPALETVQPLILPSIIPQLPIATKIMSAQAVTPVANGQDYYTLPNPQDDLTPSPIPDILEPISPQPDIIPFPNQPLDIPPTNLKNPVKNAPKTAKSSIPTVKNSVKPSVTRKNSQQKSAREAVKPDVTVTKKQQPNQENKPDNKQETQQKTIKEKTVPSLKKSNLKFADFPAKAYLGKRATPKISTLNNLNSFYVAALKGTKGEKQFIDTLNKTKPNYAGHYVITSFTCGLNCTASVAYDIKNGDFIELGGGFADCPASDFNPRQKTSITHQVTSRLLIVIGSSSSGSCVAGYFEEKNGNVNLIGQKNLMNYVDASKR